MDKFWNLKFVIDLVFTIAILLHMKRVPTNSNLVEFQVEKYSHAQIFCFQKVCLEQNAIKFDLSYQNVYICLLQIAKIYHKITKQFFIQQKLYNKLSFYKVYACENIILNRIYDNLAENWQFSSFRLFYTRNYSHIKIYTISAKQTETSMCNNFLIFKTELVYFFPIFIVIISRVQQIITTTCDQTLLRTCILLFFNNIWKRDNQNSQFW
eukprot:TRINITY_DN3445_c0_g1_i5.p1 TRINITY_DN3445_c0_g1~~TRINITY_DN3445_c0_g1_i5.p1  ORF type:complete len:210 (-),score=-10.54 TRINITY_DN3445_c0_g1_i5:110-739(-)